MTASYRFARSLLMVFALIVVLLSSGWTGGLANSTVWPAAAVQALTPVLHEDFEGVPVGALGAPWSISSAGASAVRIASTTDHGHVLQLQGSATEGDFLIASRPFSSSAADITVQVDIKRGSGAAFVWSLNGAGSSIGRRRIRLQVPAGSSTLSSQTVPSGTVNCGSLPSGVWKRVSLIVHTTTRTFDVQIDGAATACTRVAADIQPPFNSLSVMDASNAGWGGTVRFDNIDVTAP